MAAMSLRIAIVGDVHDQWDPVKDAKALRHLKPDVVLFTGDFGDENVGLVRSISKLDLPKAAILGNHDCWRTFSPFAKFLFPSIPEDESKKDGVQEQLDALGNAHVGYSRLDFPDLRFSVIGGRPFSSGGERGIVAPNPFKNLEFRYGVHNFHESAERIIKEAKEAPRGNLLVLLAHNGPRGLGSKVEDICGRDWSEHGGDYGDPDLEEAIVGMKQEGLHVPLVVFGHMHRDLRGGKGLKRTMLVVGSNRTIYLNAAVVPRVQDSTDPGPTASTQRHFVLVDFHEREVGSIHEVWVSVGEDECESRHILMYSHSSIAPSEDSCTPA